MEQKQTFLNIQNGDTNNTVSHKKIFFRNINSFYDYMLASLMILVLLLLRLSSVMRVGRGVL